MHFRHANSWLWVFAALLATTAVFWPGLSGRFIFDDYPSIVSNKSIHIDSLDWASIKTAAGAFKQGYFGRPLATISFALDYLSWGTDPRGYKITGLAVHLLNTLLVWMLVRQLLALRRADGEQWANASAVIISVAWAIHPIQVSSVLYVVQRMETLSLLFVLAALVSYLKGRRRQIEGGNGWPWLLACPPLVLLGLASKESAALFPAYALALELTVLRFRAASTTVSRALKYAYAISAFIGLVLYLTFILPTYLDPGSYALRDFTVGQRLLTQFRVLPMYLGQILLPTPGRLTFYYDDILTSTGLFTPFSTFSGFVLLTGMATAAFFLRSRAVIASLGIIWFFAAHLITSNVFPLEHAFEHRNYFALLGVLLVIADLARRVPMRDGPALKHLAILALVIGLGLLTAIRSATWGSPLNLSMELAHANPNSARASVDLAEKYEMMADRNPESPFYSLALKEFERGSKLPAASSLPAQGMIMLAAGNGQPVPTDWWDILMSKLREGAISPQDQYAVTGLVEGRIAGVPLEDKRIADAYVLMSNRADQPSAMYALFAHHALNYLGDGELASKMFVLAVEHETEDKNYAPRLVQTLEADGNESQARAVEKRARELGLIR